jgi:GTP-binding protein
MSESVEMTVSEDMAPPTVVIIGRPNVGKSSLFNRLVGRRRSLVHDEPGVTRDRIEETAVWTLRGKRYEFRVIDTGGLGHEKFAEEIRRQVETALECAQGVIMLFDGQSGLLPEDEEILRSLRVAGMFDRDERKTPIVAVVNKVDTDAHEDRVAQFYEAGLENVLGVSAEHNRGVDELQELLLEEMEKAGTLMKELPDEDLQARKIPRIAIVGKPNVGKSTLVNALVGEERMVTSPIAGTTVDSVDSRVEIDGYPFIILDTAGIRRKDKTEQGVEVLSVVKARQALESCDVAILVIDGEKGATDQDEKIGGLIEEVGCGVILAVNKWDTQSKNREFSRDDAANRIRKQMAYLRYAPIVFMSALKGQGLEGLGELVHEILNQRQVRISTKELTEWVREAAQIHNPANAKFYLSHQVGKNPPSFVSHVSDPDKVHYSLRRHIVNGLRERWGFMGSPVRFGFHLAKHRKGPKVLKRYEKAEKIARREYEAEGGDESTT